jgi:hypothetical protein
MTTFNTTEAAGHDTPARKSSYQRWLLFWIMIGAAFYLEREYREMHISKLLFFTSFAVPVRYDAPRQRWLMYSMVAFLDLMLLYSWWRFS